MSNEEHSNGLKRRAKSGLPVRRAKQIRKAEDLQKQMAEDGVSSAGSWFGSKFSDVTIQCRGQSFKCQRIVLASRCKHFETLFGGADSKSSQDGPSRRRSADQARATSINMDEEDPKVLEAFLKYLHSHSTTHFQSKAFSHKELLGHDYGVFLVDLFIVAEKYDQPLLAELIISMLAAGGLDCSEHDDKDFYCCQLEGSSDAILALARCTEAKTSPLQLRLRDVLLQVGVGSIWKSTRQTDLNEHGQAARERVLRAIAQHPGAALDILASSCRQAASWRRAYYKTTEDVEGGIIQREVDAMIEREDDDIDSEAELTDDEEVDDRDAPALVLKHEYGLPNSISMLDDWTDDEDDESDYKTSDEEDAETIDGDVVEINMEDRHFKRSQQQNPIMLD